MRPLTADLAQGGKRAYFLWDEALSITELLRLLGKMLREARDIDVGHFVTPAEVAQARRRRLRAVPPQAKG